MKKILFGHIAFAFFSAFVCQAEWLRESVQEWNNQLAVPEANSLYEFHPGWNLDEDNWFWDRASGIKFQMNGFADSNAGVSLFGMKFEFSRPLSSFRFTTPDVVNRKCAGKWVYSTDGITWKTLRHNGETEVHTAYPSMATPDQTFTRDDNVTRIWLQYDAAISYMGVFRTDGNMKLNVTTF